MDNFLEILSRGQNGVRHILPYSYIVLLFFVSITYTYFIVHIVHKP